MMFLFCVVFNETMKDDDDDDDDVPVFTTLFFVKSLSAQMIFESALFSLSFRARSCNAVWGNFLCSEGTSFIWFCCTDLSKCM